MSLIVRGLSEVARHFGKSTRTAQRWRQAGMPKLAGGRFDLDQVETWLKSARYLGASLRQLADDNEIQDLFELAVVELRRGLKHLCESFVKARGKTRARLVDGAIRDILRGVHHQQSLLEKEGGGAPKNDKPGRPGDSAGPGGEIDHGGV
jgi:hypothetical protein